MKIRAKELVFPMSIGEVAAAVRRKPPTLRYYERIGIVRPLRFGADKRRWYLEADVDAILAYQAKHGKQR